MKTKGLLTYLILLSFIFGPLCGQQDCCCKNTGINSSEQYLSGDLFETASTIDATTFFNQEWLPGDIFLSDGEVARNKLIKYNGLIDELFWKESKSDNIIKLDKEGIAQFHFLNFQGDTSLYFRKIKVKLNTISDSSEIFAQLIYNGTISLYVLHTFFIDRKESINENGIQLERNIYAEEPNYVFRFSSNKTIILRKLNKNNLYTLSPDNKAGIKEFLRNNKTGKLTDNSPLIRFTQFLSKIVNSK
jgi:hypothetical protein